MSTTVVTTKAPGFFDALTAIFGAVFTACTVIEKTVHLAENEVDNLSEYQLMRLDSVKSDRAQQQAALALL